MFQVFEQPMVDFAIHVYQFRSNQEYNSDCTQKYMKYSKTNYANSCDFIPRWANIVTTVAYARNRPRSSWNHFQNENSEPTIKLICMISITSSSLLTLPENRWDKWQQWINSADFQCRQLRNGRIFSRVQQLSLLIHRISMSVTHRLKFLEFC